MTVTEEGIRVVEQLNDFMHEIKGLNDVEEFIKTSLRLKRCNNCSGRRGK